MYENIRNFDEFKSIKAIEITSSHLKDLWRT